MTQCCGASWVCIVEGNEKGHKYVNILISYRIIAENHIDMSNKKSLFEYYEMVILVGV